METFPESVLIVFKLHLVLPVFRFTKVKQVGTKLFVNATDVEGTDLASLLLEVGLPAENGFDCK